MAAKAMEEVAVETVGTEVEEMVAVMAEERG